MGKVAILDPVTHQPIDSFAGLVVKSAIWIAALLVVFVPLGIRLYRKLS